MATFDTVTNFRAAGVLDRCRAFVGPDLRLSFAPGRINLIGEHTDYTDGFVLPVSLALGTWIAASPRADRMIRIYSEGQNEVAVIDLDKDLERARGNWSDYVAGVAWAMQKFEIELRGADLWVGSDLPMGAGLSSSASLEVAAAYAFLSVVNRQLAPMQIARACQLAENDFVGARCGLMDQFIATHGQPRRALLLDCLSLKWRSVDLPATHRWIVANTMVRHALAHGEYNNRRAECERIVEAMHHRYPGRPRIADLNQEEAAQLATTLDPHLRRRFTHVYEENRRVLEMVTSLEACDVATAGRLLLASHESLRSQFEVSCPELDLMVELAMRIPGILGARMIGGGFGGCTLSLVDGSRAGEAAATLREMYARANGTDPYIYMCEFGGAGGTYS